MRSLRLIRNGANSTYEFSVVKRTASMAKVGIMLGHAPTKAAKWYNIILPRLFSTKRRAYTVFKLHSYQHISPYIVQPSSKRV